MGQDGRVPLVPPLAGVDQLVGLRPRDVHAELVEDVAVRALVRDLGLVEAVPGVRTIVLGIVLGADRRDVLEHDPVVGPRWLRVIPRRARAIDG